MINKETELPIMNKLKERISKTGRYNIISAIENKIKFQIGQAVILCDSYDCSKFLILFLHLKLSYSNDHYIHSFSTLSVRKSHSHSLKIYKL